MQIHDGTIRWRGSVKRNLCTREIHLFGSSCDECSNRNRNIFPTCTPRHLHPGHTCPGGRCQGVCVWCKCFSSLLFCSLFNGWKNYLAQISHTMKRMHMESITELTCKFCQTSIDSCNVYWNIW